MWELDVLAILMGEGGGGAKHFHPLKGVGMGGSFTVLRGGGVAKSF